MHSYIEGKRVLEEKNFKNDFAFDNYNSLYYNYDSI